MDFPNRNLPPEATPWGVDIERKLSFMDDTINRRNLDATNTSKAQNATTEALGGQIQSLQSALTQLSALSLNQVAPGIGSGSASGFTLTSSGATLISFNLFVPTGYTRALVIASGSVASLSAYTSSDALHAVATIGGASGPEGVSYFYAPNSGGSATCFQNVSLSGLTGGSAIGVTLAGRLNTGPGPTGGPAVFAVASLMAQAIYLK